MKWVHTKDDAPKGPHFAIIEFSSYYVEGDERSRSCPGHGYPGHSENKAEYIVFESEAEWKGEIEKRMGRAFGKPDFIAVKVTPANIQTKFVVEVQ